MSLAERAATEAEATVGLGADPAHLVAFEAFLGGPGEVPAVAHAMATDPHSSTCALAWRRWLAKAGYKDARLEPPYPRTFRGPRVGGKPPGRPGSSQACVCDWPSGSSSL